MFKIGFNIQIIQCHLLNFYYVLGTALRKQMKKIF